MAAGGTSRQRRQRGEIMTLPSGSLRVRVYAGIDPLTGKKHHLTEVIPAGKDAQKLAERARTKLLSSVDERRAPRTKATVAELMEQYLGVLEIEDTTRPGYEGLVRRHIEPLLGHIAIGRIDGETLDRFYRELRRCRKHCQRKRTVDHRTTHEHECDQRCGPQLPRAGRGVAGDGAQLRHLGQRLTFGVLDTEHPLDAKPAHQVDHQQETTAV